MSQVEVRIAPFGELVDPGGIEFRAAQASGSSAEKACAIAPFGQTRRRRDGSQSGRSARPMHGEDAGAPSIITSRTSAPVSPMRAMRPAGAPRAWLEAERQRAHPFGAGARLAGAAPAEQQPGPPGRIGRQLVGPGEERPPFGERAQALGRQRLKQAGERPLRRGSSNAFRNISAQGFHVIGRLVLRAPRGGRGGRRGGDDLAIHAR